MLGESHGLVEQDMLDIIEAKARYYYKKCLSMNFNEYKNSIQAKAKAGLNRIRFK